MANHNLRGSLFREELVLLVCVRKGERLNRRSPVGFVREGHPELPRVLRSRRLIFDIPPNHSPLFVGRDAVLEVDSKRRREAVLDIVDVEDRNLLLEFDVVDSSDVVRLWVVVGTYRKRLHVQNLRRVLVLRVGVEPCDRGRLHPLVHPVPRVVVPVYHLVLVAEPRTHILERKVRDVRDCGSVEAPVHLQSEAVLNLEVDSALSEFGVEVPLCCEELRVEVGGLETFPEDHHRDSRAERVVGRARVVEVYQILRVEIVVPVVYPVPLSTLAVGFGYVAREVHGFYPSRISRGCYSFTRCHRKSRYRQGR